MKLKSKRITLGNLIEGSYFGDSECIDNCQKRKTKAQTLTLVEIYL